MNRQDDDESSRDDSLAEWQPTPGAPQGGDLFVVFFFVLITWILSATLLLETGLFTWLIPETVVLREQRRGNEPTERQKSLGLLAGPAAASVAEPAFYRAQAIRLEMWARALIFPVQVIGLVLLLLGRSEINRALVGVTGQGLPRAVKLGLLGWLVLTPVILGLNWLVTTLYTEWMQVPAEEHSLVILTRVQLWPVEWVFWIFLAVVAAAVLEEYFFRGLLLAYLQAAPWRGHLVLAVLVPIAFGLNGAGIVEASDLPGWKKFEAYMPILFLLLMSMVYLLTLQYAAETPWPNYLLVSLFFAIIHTTWPQPVALLVLSLGLCYLRDRSGSLVAPMLVHGLFNATSIALYFLFPG